MVQNRGTRNEAAKLVLTKETKTYTGKKRVYSTNCAGKFEFLPTG